MADDGMRCKRAVYAAAPVRGTVIDNVEVFQGWAGTVTINTTAMFIGITILYGKARNNSIRINKKGVCVTIVDTNYTPTTVTINNRG